MTRFGCRRLTAMRCALHIGLILFLLTTTTQAFERFYVAKISDYDGTQTLKVMSPDEYKALEKQIRAESRAVPKAAQAAKKEWDAARKKGEMSFPSFKPRRIARAGSYDSREKAEKKVAAFEEREAEKAEEQRQKEKAARAKGYTKEKAEAFKAQQAEEKAQKQKAYAMFSRYLGGGGNAAPIPGAAAIANNPAAGGGLATEKAKYLGKEGEGGGKLIDLTLSGELKADGKSLYIKPDPGQTVLGLKPWGFVVKTQYIQDGTVKRDMVGRKVTFHIIGEAWERKTEVKIRMRELKSFKVHD